MSKHFGKRALPLALSLALACCASFSGDGGMDFVATTAGTGINKQIVVVRSEEDAAAARAATDRLLKRALTADAAVQIALLNNPGLQAAYNRLGVAEAIAVQASRPPLPSFSYDWVKTSIELDIERQIVASVLSLATWPARSRLAGVRFEQAVDRAGQVASDSTLATICRSMSSSIEVLTQS